MLDERNRLTLPTPPLSTSFLLLTVRPCLAQPPLCHNLAPSITPWRLPPSYVLNDPRHCCPRQALEVLDLRTMPVPGTFLQRLRKSFPSPLTARTFGRRGRRTASLTVEKWDQFPLKIALSKPQPLLTPHQPPPTQVWLRSRARATLKQFSIFRSTAAPRRWPPRFAAARAFG